MPFVCCDKCSKEAIYAYCADCKEAELIADAGAREANDEE